MSEPLILIPARMASTRLPGKPLADIHGEPMIVHVWRRALEAHAGRVAVAAAEAEIVDAIRSAGGEAVQTDPNHPSGSDRIFEALLKLDPEGRHQIVVNVQGDLPSLDTPRASGYHWRKAGARCSVLGERLNTFVAKARNRRKRERKISRQACFRAFARFAF